MAEDPSPVALVEIPPCTEEAVSAGGAEAAKNAVAHVRAAHLLSGRDHGANELMPDREARIHGHPAVEDVKVRATDARPSDPDDGVVRGAQLGLGPLLDSHLSRGVEGDRLHRLSVTCAWDPKGASSA